MLDALNAATGTTEKFPLQPAGTRAIALPDTTYPSYFLDTFGRPFRVQACECERTAEPTLNQALHLMNGDLVNRKVSQPDGRLSQLLRDPKLTDDTLIDVLYHFVTFNCPPTPDELSVARGLLGDSSLARRRGAGSLLGVVELKGIFVQSLDPSFCRVGQADALRGRNPP